MFHPIFRAMLYQELDEEQRANPNLLAYPQHLGVGVALKNGFQVLQKYCGWKKSCTSPVGNYWYLTYETL